MEPSVPIAVVGNISLDVKTGPIPRGSARSCAMARPRSVRSTSRSAAAVPTRRLRPALAGGHFGRRSGDAPASD